MIAEAADLLIGTTLTLPSLYQRTVVKINVQIVVGAAKDLHLENQLGGFSEEGFFQPLQALTFSALLDQICTLVESTPLDGSGSILLGIEPLLFGFVAEQIHPQCTVFQLFADGLQEAVFDFGFIDNAHDHPPLWVRRDN